MTLAKLIGFIFIFGVISYSGISLLAHFLSEKIIFQPQPSSYRDTERIIKLESAGGVPISAVYLPNPRASYTILFSHGNAEDVGTALPTLERLRAAGFSVFAYDYRGYGTSAGSPSEENAYRDAGAAYDYLTGQLGVPADRTIAYGRSLGGAVAVELARRRPLAGLVVEGTFTSAYRVVTKIPLLPFDKFKTLSKIKEVRCPVLVIHGRRDEVVPFPHGEELFLAANEPKASYWVAGAGHNDLAPSAGGAYEKALLGFVGLIEKKSGGLD